MEAQYIIFDFKGLWEIPSKCGVRIWERENCQVVIVSELYRENPGSSIAQVSASLAMQICNVYGLDYKRLIYIEHNPAIDSKLSFYDEEMFLVRFDTDDFGLTNPSWERIDVEQIKKYIE